MDIACFGQLQRLDEIFWKKDRHRDNNNNKKELRKLQDQKDDITFLDSFC